MRGLAHDDDFTIVDHDSLSGSSASHSTEQAPLPGAPDTADNLNALSMSTSSILPGANDTKKKAKSVAFDADAMLSDERRADRFQSELRNMDETAQRSSRFETVRHLVEEDEWPMTSADTATHMGEHGSSNRARTEASIGSYVWVDLSGDDSGMTVAAAGDWADQSMLPRSQTLDLDLQ